MAWRMAGVSVIVVVLVLLGVGVEVEEVEVTGDDRRSTGTRILGLMARRDSGAPAVALMVTERVVKGCGVLCRRMCAARAQEPGALMRVIDGIGVEVEEGVWRGGDAIVLWLFWEVLVAWR